MRVLWELVGEAVVVTGTSDFVPKESDRVMRCLLLGFRVEYRGVGGGGMRHVGWWGGCVRF